MSYGEFLGDKIVMYIMVTLYRGYLIVLWLFNPQTASRGQIWLQPSYVFDNFFGVSYNDTNLRDFVTTSVN